MRGDKPTPECDYCVLEDDVAHTLCGCIRWEERWKRFTANNLRTTLTAKEEKYRSMYSIVRYIIKMKEKVDKDKSSRTVAKDEVP